MSEPRYYDENGEPTEDAVAFVEGMSDADRDTDRGTICRRAAAELAALEKRGDDLSFELRCKNDDLECVHAYLTDAREQRDGYMNQRDAAVDRLAEAVGLLKRSLPFLDHLFNSSAMELKATINAVLMHQKEEKLMGHLLPGDECQSCGHVNCCQACFDRASVELRKAHLDEVAAFRAKVDELSKIRSEQDDIIAGYDVLKAAIADPFNAIEACKAMKADRDQLADLLCQVIGGDFLTKCIAINRARAYFEARNRHQPDPCAHCHGSVEGGDCGECEHGAADVKKEK